MLAGRTLSEQLLTPESLRTTQALCIRTQPRPPHVVLSPGASPF